MMIGFLAPQVLPISPQFQGRFVIPLPVASVDLNNLQNRITALTQSTRQDGDWGTCDTALRDNSLFIWTYTGSRLERKIGRLLHTLGLKKGRGYLYNKREGLHDVPQEVIKSSTDLFKQLGYTSRILELYWEAFKAQVSKRIRKQPPDNDISYKHAA